MDTTRYYFTNFIEDDELSILAVQARQVMEQNDNIAQVFRINNEILYGHSPRQVLFLMKQNNKSIFSPSSSKESSPSDAKSQESISTPIRCNPEASKMPRKYLPLDDTEEKECHPTTLEFSTPIGRQKSVVQPSDKGILNSSMDKTGTSDEQFASKVGSTDSQESSPSAEIAKMTTNLTIAEKEFGSPAKVVDKIDASSQESSPSSEIAKMTINLTIAEKEFGSSAKVVGSIDESSQESPSVKVSMMSTNIVMAEKEFSSPAKEVGNVKLRNQESPRSAEITRLTSRLTVDDKESINLIRDDQMAGNLAINKDSPKYEEITGESEKTDSTNKNLIGHAEEMKISEPALIGRETPSPIKRTKMSSIPTCDSQTCASPAKKNRMGENSPEGTQSIASHIQGDKLDISPNETIKEIPRGDIKRKSLPPKKRITALFKSMPRVIKLDGEEIDVEVADLEYGASPTTSRSKSADYRRDSTKEGGMISPIGDKSKSDTSPKTPERYLRPSERVISAGSSRNVSVANSSSSDDDVFVGKHQSSSPSIVETATSDRSCKFEYSSNDLEASPVLLKATILKFKTLLDIRDRIVKRSFVSFQTFQAGLDFLRRYIYNILHILMRLDTSGKYSTEQFKEIVRDANNIAVKLINRLKSWKKDVDFDIETWHTCFHRIEQLKARYEPLFNDEDEPVATLEVVQAYESHMKGIWKKIDDIIMLGDSRRALFSHFAHDVERLMKMFVKCLILVGILQCR